nr:MAG TPA: hypothetical protein [Caudoviricetes sp.]
MFLAGLSNMRVFCMEGSFILLEVVENERETKTFR